MNIAELFVNLGVKGSEKAVQALSGVKKNLGEVSSMSLEAKAAIIGVVYGLERLMSNSAKTGTDLANFSAATGLSAKGLQQWQYAARQAGVSSEELTGSLKGVQQSMTNMLLGKGAPEGMAMLANRVGFDKNKARDTFYVMEQLQKFSQVVPPDVGAQMVKSFGATEGVFAAMRRNAFNPAIMAKAPTYSEKEISNLDKVNVGWANLGQKIQMAMGHLTSKHGMELLKDVEKLTMGLIKLAEVLTVIGEKLKLFKLPAMVIEGWLKIFQGAQSISSGETSGKDVGSALWNMFKEDVSGSGEWNKASPDEKKYQEELRKRFAPKVDESKARGPGANNDVNIEQNLIFQHDGKDAQKTAGSVHKAVRDAYRQMQAQTQGA